MPTYQYTGESFLSLNSALFEQFFEDILLTGKVGQLQPYQMIL